MSGQMMAILLPIVALVLVGFFALVWTKDRNRSEEESHDSTRMDTDNSTRTETPPRRSGNDNGGA